MSKVHNFSAGPCILPQEVLKQASEAVINFNNLNLSLIEISHRSKDFVEVMEKAQALVKELLGVPDGYSIMFLQGGASLGFLKVPYNFMKENGSAAYVNTGVWASKALEEAQKMGTVHEIASSKDKNFNYIPKKYQIPGDADYLHITTNNTIFGTQFKNIPISRIPIVADMSSDIFSKKIDVSQFDMIYAGAQKNMGPAGTTLYIVKDSALGKSGRKIPTMLDLQTHIKKESMFNTPPVFPIYVSMLTLQWLKDNGGVEWIENVNQQKADLLYNEIDANPLFEGTANVADRSNMNATFVLKDESLTDEFNKMWQAANISGIKGPRLGKKMKSVSSKINTLTTEEISQFELKGAIELTLDGGEVVRISSDEIEIQRTGLKGWSVESEDGITVAVDTEITPELQKEGFSREFINRIQNMRKEADFDVTDRIAIGFDGSDELTKAIEATLETVKSETLAEEVKTTVLDVSDFVKRWDIEGSQCEISIRRTTNK